LELVEQEFPHLRNHRGKDQVTHRLSMVQTQCFQALHLLAVVELALGFQMVVLEVLEAEGEDMQAQVVVALELLVAHQLLLVLQHLHLELVVAEL
jgi:hypothetical protein